MAPTRVITIDSEWAEKLIGIHVSVPNHWWQGLKGRKLWTGVVVSFDVDQQKWMFVLDDKDEEYGLNYSALLEYIDVNAESNIRYTNNPHLMPSEPFRGNGEEELAIAAEGVITRYQKTDESLWTQVTDGGRDSIKPIEWSRRDIDSEDWHDSDDEEDFTVKATDEERLEFEDETGEIKFARVFEWTLPLFNDESVTLFHWQAARMRSYMVRIMNDTTINYKPKYFNPPERVIKGHHVARYYGCCLARMLHGNPSIERMYSSRNTFDAVEVIKNCMPQDAMKELTRCLHFADDWEQGDDEEWDTIYSDVKVQADENTASHRKNFSLLEDMYNKRWQACVTYGKWITADESRIAGWYKSAMTIGPEPKPIRTGITMHTLCVTKGKLSTYKLFVRCFGGRTDGDLCRRHPNCETLLKFVTLYSIMLSSFMGRGHCLVMDSAYMGDVMALIGRNIWKINMVGTCQVNRTGAGVKATSDISENVIGKGTYECLFYQHATLPLTYSIWSDNNYVKTLSNFHQAKVVVKGLNRKKKDATGRRELSQTPVDVSAQQKDYCETYHLIDKGNGAEEKFALCVESKKHGWTPKIAARLFNMNSNNAYQIYKALVSERRYKAKPRRDCMCELATELLNRGPNMRIRKSGSPPTAAVTSLQGRKIRTDSKKTFSTSPQGRNHPQTPRTSPRKRTTSYMQKKKFKSIVKDQPWRSHQSVATVCEKNGGYCQYRLCPGLSTPNKARKRPFTSVYRCYECSIKKGKNVFLCNSIKKGKAILCHMKYHQTMESEVENSSEDVQNT